MQVSKLSIPNYIMFTQRVEKHPHFVGYELWLFGRVVFYYSGKTLKECFKARDAWLKENRA